MEASESVAAPRARASAFDAVAESYDRSFTASLIGGAQRRAVWRELDSLFHKGDRILELNCGTGVDAIHLGERGIEVLACDGSRPMVEVAQRRLAASLSGARIQFRTLATEDLGALAGNTPFDGALSNFAGLNCVEDLSGFARSLHTLLRPGAKVLLCVFSSCCVWEMLWYLGHGKFRKALRRFGSNGTVADLGGKATVRVHYPSVRKLTAQFAPGFKLIRWRGVGVAVPPSYLEPWAKRFPGVLSLLEGLDHFMARIPLARALGDHILLTLERA